MEAVHPSLTYGRQVVMSNNDLINIAVVGAGYWGPNLVRNFSTTNGAKVITVCDLSESRLQRIGDIYPSVKLEKNYDAVLKDQNVHAVAIATPVHTHYALAKAALEAGKHVLLEKPMAECSEKSKALMDLAQKVNRVLLIDHTFIYMGAVRKLKSLVESGELGTINYYDSIRVNLGLFQNDINVAWDLAVHDISILYYLFPERPIGVSATGKSHVAGQPENVVFMTLFYPNAMIAHINVNWLSPVKIRQTLISGSKKMVVFDDLHASEKIKIYDSGISVKNIEDINNAKVEYRIGDILIPTYPRTEALAVEATHFISCIRGEEEPCTGAKMGHDIVKLLETAQQSLKTNGNYVEVK